MSRPTPDRTAINTCTEYLFKTLSGDAPTDLIETCPGWTVADLTLHVAFVFEMMTYSITHNANPYRRDLPAANDEPALTVLRSRWKKLSLSLDNHKDLDPAWNWTKRDQTVEWIIRRLTHEIAIHSVDAAYRTSRQLQPEELGINQALAADGIDEFLTIFLRSREPRHS
ncbi:MAG: maleylpyruvate isomerase N-terminal domain-containing protein [Ferrimicrobium sp.]